MRKAQGFTLVELLAAMVIFSIVVAAAIRMVAAQSRAFNRGADDMGVLLNLSFGADNLESQMRTAGANTRDEQPPVVYAGPATFAFNADYVSNDVGDLFAVYVDPDAPPAQVEAIRVATPIVIPNSAPAFAYPGTDYLDRNGLNGSAETIMLYFTPDLETPRVDDFILMRQVNNVPAEALVRRIVQDGATPFFRYYQLQAPPNGQPPVLTLVPDAQLPLAHAVPIHLSSNDVNMPIDALRAVQVTYAVTNGYTDARERRQRISLNIPLPNMGLRQVKVCGSEPVLGSALAGVFDDADGTDKIRLTWNRAFDEAQGDRDVVRYVIWRRRVPDAWADPLTSVNAVNQANYLYTDTQSLVRGETYEYRLAAQDCSPKLSPTVGAVVVTPPPLP